MADFYDLVARRASCRSYLPDPIPEEVLRRILTAGCQSPNGGGFQTYSILCIQDPVKKKALAKLCRNQGFIADQARKTGGEELASQVLEDIRAKGYVGPYQYWFGVYYTEDEEFLHNRDYGPYFRARGFSWLPDSEEETT